MPRDDIQPDRPGEPANLPSVEGERVQVYTELGVPIYFDPTSREFLASVGAPESEGQPLHSADFAEILKRIRQRCLTEPVKAYLIQMHVSQYRRPHHGEQLVSVDEVTIVEYHKGRNAPFVIETKGKQLRRLRPYGKETETVDVVRLEQTDRDMYLPTAEDIARLNDIATRMQAEWDRHNTAMHDLEAEKTQAFIEIRRVTQADITYVQKKHEQIAEPGLTTFDREPDDE